MRFLRYALLAVSLLLIAAGDGSKGVEESKTDNSANEPEYVIHAKELLGAPLEKSQAIVRATTDFGRYRRLNISYGYPNHEYGRTMPYFAEARFTPIETFTLNRKAYLSLSVTNLDRNITGREVGKIELTHLGVVSAEEALMMLGYDPNQLVEHPIKHRNAERSDWFGVIGPYFHIIEIQWFDAKQLNRPGKFGSVTQIRVSVW
ncbi:MAG: hypothetical protein OXP71_03175 [Candidatus Poribacteria bacterium]|nr:hypothetical protein [Candidatus Poribacteria bacterium]